MKQRGRASTAALSVVAQRSIDGRPRAPENLSKRQCEIWDEVVASEPADQFRTAALRQLLADYCRHRETVEFLSVQVEQAIKTDSEVSLDDLTKLVRLRDCETKASADKATKLRITNQARYTPQAAATAAKNASPEKKLWQRQG